MEYGLNTIIYSEGFKQKNDMSWLKWFKGVRSDIKDLNQGEKWKKVIKILDVVLRQREQGFLTS